MIRQDPTHLGKIVLCNSYSSIQLAFTSTVFCYKGPKILKGFHLFYFIPIYEKISLFLENTILFFHIHEESISLAFSFDSVQNLLEFCFVLRQQDSLVGISYVIYGVSPYLYSWSLVYVSKYYICVEVEKCWG